MKYIRTKDGKIYDKGKIICYAFREEYCSPNWNEDIEKYLQTKIVAEADTIEELCDEFIYVNKIEGLTDKTHTISFEDMPNHQFTEPTVAEKMEYIHKRYEDDLDKIKLGIWTDKGLIYVAKMNGKGTLESL